MGRCGSRGTDFLTLVNIGFVKINGLDVTLKARSGAPLSR